MKMFTRYFINCLFLFLGLGGCSDRVIQDQKLLTKVVKQYEKAEFRFTIGETFNNPYDQREIALNLLLKSPSGDSVFLPCYFERNEGTKSMWIARFAPREHGKYMYYFELIKDRKNRKISAVKTFTTEASEQDGFLHIHDLWTLRFDSGRPFRGIGENIGWEARSFSDPKWNYDYLLPTLSNNGANFFRSWMAPNNFPLEWKKVKSTKRYTDTDAYFNQGGVKRLDEVLDLADSLGLYIMLTFDSHNTLITGNQWEIHNYNVVNGGPAKNPEEFFTLEESREKYKNRLRYIVARWGYSTRIGAWEFFNEIDNAAFNKKDSIIISHEAITSWHKEMASYLKTIDPYDHIVTSSVSHREIKGLFSLDELDLNQMHIYKRTDKIPAGIKRYTEAHKKPFSWGEFGYEWDWNKDFNTMGEEFDFDYKRGLWYGMFSPTPILPMTWWWEFFDERGMTSYFRSVRVINDRMLEAGVGAFEEVEIASEEFEAYGVKCGDTYFVYLLNSSSAEDLDDIWMDVAVEGVSYNLESFSPIDGSYQSLDFELNGLNGISVPNVHLVPKHELILILSPV
ncbi:MAG TPA: cellulase family glycosylhydrolase [Chryseosolibacter sp.]